jgi:hypothetical protein
MGAQGAAGPLAPPFSFQADVCRQIVTGAALPNLDSHSRLHMVKPDWRAIALIWKGLSRCIPDVTS